MVKLLFCYVSMHLKNMLETYGLTFCNDMHIVILSNRSADELCWRILHSQTRFFNVPPDSVCIWGSVAMLSQ